MCSVAKTLIRDDDNVIIESIDLAAEDSQLVVSGISTALDQFPFYAIDQHIQINWVYLYTCIIVCSTYQVYSSGIMIHKMSYKSDLWFYNIMSKINSIEGRGAMARARSFANAKACRAVSNPTWCRIFWEISCFSPLNIGTLFRCCVPGQDTLPPHASLDSCVNEYLVG